MKRDYYEVLGIGRDADDGTVKRAYRKLAKQYHPDTNSGSVQAEERFKEVTEAYHILSDPEKRKLYDRFGHAAFEEGAAASENGGSGYNSGGGTYRSYGFEGGDMRDIFEQFFGSGFHESRFDGFDEEMARTGGADITADLDVSFEEAAFGGRKTVHLRNSSGEVQSYEVKIPAGIATGKTIRLKGRGKAGGRGFPPGDLLLKVKVQEKPGVRREGQDVYTTIQIPFATAVFGGEVPVQTIDGRVLCKIQPGTQCGSKIRLRGKGIVWMNQPSRRGDQYVTVEIQVPRNLSGEARQKLKEFAQA